jgi:hypothetical protein
MTALIKTLPMLLELTTISIYSGTSPRSPRHNHSTHREDILCATEAHRTALLEDSRSSSNAHNRRLNSIISELKSQVDSVLSDNRRGHYRRPQLSRPQRLRNHQRSRTLGHQNPSPRALPTRSLSRLLRSLY